MDSDQFVRGISFVCSVSNSLVAGFMSTIPIYGPRLILDLGYTQAQLNAVSTIAMLSTFLMSPVGGYLCRRLSPRILSLICGGLLGGGYLMTASAFMDAHVSPGGSSFMNVAFAHFMIGSGTSSIQLSALDACAKNLQGSRYNGLLMSIPVTAVGFGGISVSQISSHFFMTRQDAASPPHLDSGRFLVLLSSLAVLAGLMSGMGLATVPQKSRADPVVVADSGDSDQGDPLVPKGKATSTYGGIDEERATAVSESGSSDNQSRRTSWGDIRGVCQVPKGGGDTLIRDGALWWLMLGLALLPGPIAVYLNNLGTIITAINGDLKDTPNSRSGASQVVQQITILSTVATITRLSLGVLSDRVAPSPDAVPGRTGRYRTRFTVLVLPAGLTSLGYLLLSTATAQWSNSRFTLHICSALLGLGYGCNSAILPVIAQAWGPENFSIICSWIGLSPAPAIAIWGWLYSHLYEWALGDGMLSSSSQCVGWNCYGIWALVSCVAAALSATSFFASCCQLRSRGIVV